MLRILPSGVSDADKFQMEKEGFMAIKATLDAEYSGVGDELLALWEEYEEGTTACGTFLAPMNPSF